MYFLGRSNTHQTLAIWAVHNFNCFLCSRLFCISHSEKEMKMKRLLFVCTVMFICSIQIEFRMPESYARKKKNNRIIEKTTDQNGPIKPSDSLPSINEFRWKLTQPRIELVQCAVPQWYLIDWPYQSAWGSSFSHHSHIDSSWNTFENEFFPDIILTQDLKSYLSLIVISTLNALLLLFFIKHFKKRKTKHSCRW